MYHVACNYMAICVNFWWGIKNYE